MRWGTWVRRGPTDTDGPVDGPAGPGEAMPGRVLRFVAPATGALLVWSSLAFAGYAAGWTVHQHRAQAELVSHQSVPTRRSAAPAPCIESTPAVGQLAGILQIPAIGLTAPVEEGTGDAELAVAVGHAPASVLPGASGTAVLLAHDVSYFVHIDALRPGDLIRFVNRCSTVTFSVTGHQVVAAGSPVFNTPGPGSLVLDTCWPTNALFFTSHRLLVTAAEVSAPTPARSASRSGHGVVLRSPTSSRAPASPAVSPAPITPTVDQVSYQVPAPAALVAQGLTLTQNEAPMGTMTLTGDPSPAWVESPGPMAVTAAALEAYFGGVHAMAQDEQAWWSAIAPGVPMAGPLVGGEIVGHDAPLDVTIDSSGGTVTSVTLSTEVTVAGGSAPGSYAESVVLPVSGGTVTIGSWGMARA